MLNQHLFHFPTMTNINIKSLSILGNFNLNKGKVEKSKVRDLH